jgi:hypothetical protein
MPFDPMFYLNAVQTYEDRKELAKVLGATSLALGAAAFFSNPKTQDWKQLKKIAGGSSLVLGALSFFHGWLLDKEDQP